MRQTANATVLYCLRARPSRARLSPATPAPTAPPKSVGASGPAASFWVEVPSPSKAWAATVVVASAPTPPPPPRLGRQRLSFQRPHRSRRPYRHRIVQLQFRHAIPKLDTGSIYLIGQHHPGRHLVLHRLPNLRQRNLRLGLELHLLGYVDLQAL